MSNVLDSIFCGIWNFCFVLTPRRVRGSRQEGSVEEQLNRNMMKSQRDIFFHIAKYHSFLKDSEAILVRSANKDESKRRFQL
jgi:hypothetical protein